MKARRQRRKSRKEFCSSRSFRPGEELTWWRITLVSATAVARPTARAVAEIDVLAAVDEAFVESAELLPE